MKPLFTLLVLAATLLSADGADIALTDGRIFRDASVVSQTPRKVVIQHADGLSGVEKTLLPVDLSARYPIDEAAAREAEAQAVQARARADEFHKAEAARSAAVRLEREQTALLNAQLAAAEETAARVAELERAVADSQRTETVYGYRSYYSAPRYVYRRSHPRDCEPPRSETPPVHQFTRRDRSPFHDRHHDDHLHSPRHRSDDHAATHRRPHAPVVSSTSRPQPQAAELSELRLQALPSASIRR